MVAVDEQEQTLMPVSMPDELSPRQQLALYYEVAGEFTFQQIAAKIGVNQLTVHNWRKKPAYIAARKALLDKLNAQRFQQLVDAGSVLDAHCLEGAGHLINLMRRGEKDSDRLGAVKAVFDYSPNGPKAAKKSDESVKPAQINISLNMLKNVSAALNDVGDEETLRLVQGADGVYEAVDDADAS